MSGGGMGKPGGTFWNENRWAAHTHAQSYEEQPGHEHDIEILEKKIDKLQDDLADMILLDDAPIAVSAYEMTYEEYMVLNGNVRL